MYLLRIDGYDYSSWVMDEGMDYDDEDLDSEKSVRVKTGRMRRDKITEKANFTYKFRTMPEPLVRQLFLSLRKPEFTATVHSPMGDETKQFYCSGRPGKIHMITDEKNILWDGVSINLHEV